MSQLAVLPSPNLIFIRDSCPPLNAPRGVRSEILNWVAQVAALAEPDSIRWCDVSPGNRRRTEAASQAGPVRAFVCPVDPRDAGPDDSWVHPTVMRQALGSVFDTAMRGRTMYVIPFSTVPHDGYGFGVQLTDSRSLAAAVSRAADTGDKPLAAINAGARWVPAVHSVGRPRVPVAGDPDAFRPPEHESYTVHFPDSHEIWSYGPGFAGTPAPPVGRSVRRWSITAR